VIPADRDSSYEIELAPQLGAAPPNQNDPNLTSACRAVLPLYFCVSINLIFIYIYISVSSWRHMTASPSSLKKNRLRSICSLPGTPFNLCPNHHVASFSQTNTFSFLIVIISPALIFSIYANLCKFLISTPNHARFHLLPPRQKCYFHIKKQLHK